MQKKTNPPQGLKNNKRAATTSSEVGANVSVATTALLSGSVARPQKTANDEN